MYCDLAYDPAYVCLVECSVCPWEECILLLLSRVFYKYPWGYTKWVGSLVVAAGLSARPISSESSSGLCSPNSCPRFLPSVYQVFKALLLFAHTFRAPCLLHHGIWLSEPGIVLFTCVYLGWRVCRVLQPVGEGQRTTWGAGSLSSTGESQRWSSGCQVWWQYLYPLSHRPSPAGFLTGVGLCSRRQMNCL